MFQLQSQESFNSLIILSEHICDLINDQDKNIDELKKRILEYTQNIESHFLIQHKQDMSHVDLKALKQLLSTHEKITNLINDEKVKVSKKLKILHTGKEMQNTYPEM